MRRVPIESRLIERAVTSPRAAGDRRSGSGRYRPWGDHATLLSVCGSFYRTVRPRLPIPRLCHADPTAPELEHEARGPPRLLALSTRAYSACFVYLSVALAAPARLWSPPQLSPLARVRDSVGDPPSGQREARY